MRPALAAAALLVCSLTGGARADTTSSCLLGGPTPSFSAIRLDLPHGSSFLDLRLDAARPTTVAGTRSSWHLAEGVAVLTTRGRLVAARVLTSGSSPRKAVVEAQGQRLVSSEFIGPDAPFQHVGGYTVPTLAPGTYYAIGFGSDGDPRAPNLYWTADVRLGEAVTCAPIGQGEVFDADQTSFRGGTQVSTYGPGLGESVRLTQSTRRRLTFGLLDAAVQGTGTDQLDYRLPRTHGIVRDAIIPYASGPGTSTFTASFAGTFPMTVMAGVSLDP